MGFLHPYLNNFLGLDRRLELVFFVDKRVLFSGLWRGKVLRFSQFGLLLDSDLLLRDELPCSFLQSVLFLREVLAANESQFQPWAQIFFLAYLLLFLNKLDLFVDFLLPILLHWLPQKLIDLSLWWSDGAGKIQALSVPDVLAVVVRSSWALKENFVVVDAGLFLGFSQGFIRGSISRVWLWSEFWAIVGWLSPWVRVQPWSGSAMRFGLFGVAVTDGAWPSLGFGVVGSGWFLPTGLGPLCWKIIDFIILKMASFGSLVAENRTKLFWPEVNGWILTHLGQIGE